MSIFVSTTYFGDGSQVTDALENLERIKIRNIELGSNHAPFLKTKLSLSEDKNYIVHNYFPPNEKSFILNIASRSSRIREKSINFIKHSIIWCWKNHIDYYTIHPGFAAEAIFPLGHKGMNRNFDLKFKKTTQGENRMKVIDETIKIIRNLYNFADGKVQLLIENQGSRTSKWVTIFDSIEELELLKRGVGSSLKFNFNLAHATLSNINLEDRNIFRYIYQNSPFFEVSEISGIYDSHLLVFPKEGVIGKLLMAHKSMFKKRNIILEYRNVPLEELKKSFEEVSALGF